MKRYTTILWAAALLAGCEKEIATPTEGYGTLALTAECTSEIMALTRAEQVPFPDELPAAADLTLRIESLDPEHPYANVWARLGDYDSQADYLFATDYRIMLHTGTEAGLENSPEGPGRPYFEAVAETPVAIGIESTRVDLTAKLCNTIVRVKFTDRFKGYFEGGAKFTLTTAAGGEFVIDYTTDGLCHYVRPAEFTITGQATKQRPSATVEPQTMKFAETKNESPAAGTLYTYTFDVTDAGDTGEVKITINDTPVDTQLLADEELNDDAIPDTDN